jgi:alpha-amylase
VCVDDFHFRFAGLHDAGLNGWYATEDRGRTLGVFPMSETLRFTIPWREPVETIEYLRAVAGSGGHPIAVFADDGEKFGAWPGTYDYVHERGWLRRFLDAIEKNAGWIHTRTFSDLLDTIPPLGKVYLPDSSYREMTEWALPVDARKRYEDVCEELKALGMYDRASTFLKASAWRNFLAKYPESGEMYGKMVHVSRKVNAMAADAPGRAEALRELYRGQCNCPYWHGVFGGLYIPYLRAANYEHLVAAESVADAAAHDAGPWAEVAEADVNVDGQPELVLSTDAAWFAVNPRQGGVVYEHDIRAKRYNALATLTRRPEPYHERMLKEGAGPFHYDAFQRGSLVDHFLRQDAGIGEVSTGAAELGDLGKAVYVCASKEAADGRATVELRGEGAVWQGGERLPVAVTKTIQVAAGSADLVAAYAVTNRAPTAVEALLGVEFNFALLGGEAPDRHLDADGRVLGNLSYTAWTDGAAAVSLADEWLGLRFTLSPSVACRFATYPVRTVSQNIDRAEEVYQSTAVIAAVPGGIEPGGTLEFSIRLTVKDTGGTRVLI